MKKAALLFYLFFLLLINIDGQIVINWAYCYGGYNLDIASNILQTTDSGYIVAGRSDANGDEYALLAYVPNNTYSYIDLNPPEGVNKYQVRIEKSPPCIPDRDAFSVVSSHPFIFQAEALIENEMGSFDIYPNPFADNLIAERTKSPGTVSIELIDIYGRVLNNSVMKPGETKITIATGQLETMRLVKQ